MSSDPSTTLSVDERIALITENLAEVLNPEIIDNVMRKEGRDLHLYWGTAPTGRPHIGYLVPAIKLAQFLAAGCKITVLLADVHAQLDDLKSPPELVQYRSDFYKFAITATLRSLKVPIEKVHFVLGSSYQDEKRYWTDLRRLASVTKENEAKKAATEVVRQSDDMPVSSSYYYPLMQALDEEHLGVDAQFGGKDQRKIFVFANVCLKKMGYRRRAHLMNPMLQSLSGTKMSSSEAAGKIDLLDPADSVKKKIASAYAAPKEVEGTGLFDFVEFVLLPATRLITANREAPFIVERDDGEEHLAYTSVEKMKEDYKQDILKPQQLKAAVTKSLNGILDPVRKGFEASSDWQTARLKGYPEPGDKPKKVKEKKVGTKYAGGPKKGSAEAAEAVTKDIPVREGQKS